MYGLEGVLGVYSAWKVKGGYGMWRGVWQVNTYDVCLYHEASKEYEEHEQFEE